MKNFMFILLSLSFVACIQTESETTLKKYKGATDETLTGTYRMSCINYDPGNGTVMSQAEEIKFINSGVAQWKMIYYWGKTDCPEGQQDEVDIFDLEYSYDAESKIFYEKNLRLRVAFYGDYLDQANADDGNCGLPNWQEGVFRDVTNLGQEDNSCLSGFFIPDTEFYEREDSILTKQKIIMFGTRLLTCSIAFGVNGRHQYD